MSSKEIDRKIAVIFATDVVGYSKLMENDEDQTIKTIRSCKEILETLFKEHGGRTFNTAGDSILAEFSSAVSAVVCASEFQNLIKERNDVNNFKMNFRIGINMGDVVKEGQDLYGDGVNVAARLESLAQPNGITLSKSVYDLVNKKTQFLFNDLGEQKVKENQFHAFDVVLDPSHKRTIKPQSSSRMPLYAGFVAILLIGVGSIFYFNILFQKNEINLDSEKSSLLIVPFVNQSGNNNNQYISDGISSHISTTLSKIDKLFVLDKSSAEFLQTKNITNTQLKEKYGIQFMLEGTIQVVDAKTRINVLLRDLRKNEVIWSEIFDYRDQDVFEVQDSLSNSILENIIPGVLSLTVGDTHSKRKFLPEVHINRLKGRVAFDSFTVEGYYEYEKLLNLNRDLEPNNLYLDMDEAWFYMLGIWLGLSGNIEKDANEAHRLTLNVVRKDPEYAYASNLAAMLESQYLGDLDAACGRLEKLEQISTDASNIEMTASRARNCGKYEKSLKLYTKALKMAPHIGLGMNKAYAVTFLMNAFEENKTDFLDAKDFIKSQINENYSEEGINEMWLMMLAYLAAKEGEQDLALEYFSQQAQMGIPITKESIKNSNFVGKENDAFFQDYIKTLMLLGMPEK